MLRVSSFTGDTLAILDASEIQELAATGDFLEALKAYLPPCMGAQLYCHGQVATWELLQSMPLPWELQLPTLQGAELLDAATCLREAIANAPRL